MSTEKLRPFRLEEFKSNEETPVVLEDGGQVEVFVRKQCASLFPVIGSQLGLYNVTTYTTDGRQFPDKPVAIFFALRKKVVPLSLEDIKPGMVFKFECRCGIEFPTSAGKDGIVFGAIGVFSYADLRRDSQYSFDCLTWHRCEKEVDA